MKARLMFRDRDLDPAATLPWNGDELSADLELAGVVEAMARGDELVASVARTALLTGPGNDIATIRFRQAVLGDVLASPGALRALYEIAGSAAQHAPPAQRSSLARFPDWVVRSAIPTVEALLATMERLRDAAASHHASLASEGLTRLSSALARDLDRDYCADVRRHLRRLRFPEGILIGAGLGPGNRSAGHVLLEPPGRREELWITRYPWLIRLIERVTGLEFDPFSFTLDPLDHGNAQALASLQNRGLAPVATALGEAGEHMVKFLGDLRAELAFYVGALNLHETLSGMGVATAMPVPGAGPGMLSFSGLRDAALALRLGRRVVANDLDADGRSLIFVTGANQGGKSTLLRAIGLAQLMMQSGLFVTADAFTASLTDGLATHYRREEDAAMKSGKLDEELARMSRIIDHMTPDGMILFNESFAATNEREGSEIARQIMTALLARKRRMIAVSHLYELTRGFVELGRDDVLFLRAERLEDGSRTFRIVPGEPLASSFAADLFQEIFGSGSRPPPG